MPSLGWSKGMGNGEKLHHGLWHSAVGRSGVDSRHEAVSNFTGCMWGGRASGLGAGVCF